MAGDNLPMHSSAQTTRRAALKRSSSAVLSDFHVSEEDFVEPWCNQLESKDFADEDPVFVPADVAAIVHPSQKETLRVCELGQPAWPSDGAPVVQTRWNLVVQALMRALVIEHVTKVIEPALLCAKDAAAVSSSPPSACDASAHGGRFVVVGLLECVHARSRASSSRAKASTDPIELCQQMARRCLS